MVSDTIQLLKDQLIGRVEAFRAGSISRHLSEWRNITNDLTILDTVSGMSIDFETSPPHSSALPTSNLNAQEEQFITTEIATLLSKGIITQSNHEVGEYISPIFLTPKSDGGFRLILNLKNLNQYMPYIHFKMDTASIN